MPTVHDQIIDHLPDLTRYAFSLAGPACRADAEDLLQDCVERALDRSDGFEEGTNLRAWLFTLMRNIFISRKRHEQVRRRYAERQEQEGIRVQPANQEIRLMLNETVEHLQTLSRGEREMIFDLAIHERGQESVARKLNTSVGTVKSRLSRSRAKLRGHLGGLSGRDISALTA